MTHIRQKLSATLLYRDGFVACVDQPALVCLLLSDIAQKGDEDVAVFGDRRLNGEFNQKYGTVLAFGFQLHSAFTDNTFFVALMHPFQTRVMAFAHVFGQDDRPQFMSNDIFGAAAKNLFGGVGVKTAYSCK